MGKTCCCAGTKQTFNLIQPFQQNSPTNRDDDEYLAIMISPRQLILLSKIQARFRGMKTRERLRGQPDFAAIFQKVEDKSMAVDTYYSQQVQAVIEELGDFDYGKAPSINGNNLNIENQNLDFRPIVQLENKAKYEGQWVTGTQTRQGKGKLIWPDGSIYEGWWKDSVAYGMGRLVHQKGDVYIGEWADDMAHGMGKYLREDGSTYEGMWFNNV